MFLIQKYTQYKAAQAEQSKRKVTEKELSQLNHKIDKLLNKLDEHEPEIASNQDEECVVCVNAKATMETYPCGHRVICRKCFVKTIQMAVAQRLLPLRCVICRAKILRLKHLSGMVPISSSSSTSSSTGGSWYHVPQSASLYSVTSNTSAVSGVSSASSCSSASSYKTCASSFSFRKSHSTYSKMGYEPLRSSSPSPTRRVSATHTHTHAHTPQAKSGIATMMIKKDNRVSPAETVPIPPKGKLKLVQDFQREFRISQQNSSNSNCNKSRLSTSSSTSNSISGSSGSTRIKCAKHLVSQAQSTCTLTKEGLIVGLPRGNGNGTTTTMRKVGSGTTPSQSCPSFKQLRVSSNNNNGNGNGTGTEKLGKLESTPQINYSHKSMSFKQSTSNSGPGTKSSTKPSGTSRRNSNNSDEK